MLEPATPPRRGRRLLIAAAIVLPMSFLPWTCNVNIGAHHWSWSHAGPLICGAIAALLALIALARGGHVVAGLGLEALGAAAIVYGLATMASTGGAPDAADLRGASDRVFAALRDGKPDAIAAVADPELPIESVRRLAATVARRFGRWQSTDGVRTTIGADDQVAADGTANYERGSATFQLVFRMRDGAPRLAGIDLHVPVEERPTDPAGAEQAARALAADFAAGALDRATDDLDPRIDLPPSLGDQLKLLHAQAGDAPAIQLDAQSACGGDQQCIDLVIQTPAGPVPLHVVEEPTYGQWLATTFKLGKGAP